MTRGRKSKPTHLHLVDGTHRDDRHGDKAKAREAVAASLASFGHLQRPKGLKGEALAAWKKFIEPANWLDGSREPAAIAFCELWAEFRRAPAAFQAAKHTQLRGYMTDLGITDERRRVMPEPPGDDEFFNDGES